MHKIRTIVAFLAVLTLLLSTAAADEGMWMLDSLSDLPYQRLADKGLGLTMDQIYTPDAPCLAKAVVKLGGGTGSFVSAKGLMVTNHHIAFQALQKQATKQLNFVRDGYWARTTSEEIPAKNYEAYVLMGLEPITDRILDDVTDDLTDLQRYLIIERNTKTAIASCEKDRDVRCEVYPGFNGLRYHLFTYFLIKDIRVVYAPPNSIGVFGGDIDNWTWPRHTGDFAFMRAYVSPTGASAQYNEQNVPYRPEVHLSLSAAGVKENDVTLTLGYPYLTNRYLSSHAIKDAVEFQLPWRIRTLDGMIKILEAEQSRDEEVRLALSHRVGRLNNYHKKNVGVLKGLKATNLFDQKKSMERQTAAALVDRPDMLKSFVNTRKELDTLFTGQYASFKKKESTLNWMAYYCNLLRFAVTINKWSLEKGKPDVDREPRYMDRNIPLIRTRLRNAQRDLAIPAEKKLLRFFIDLALALPENQRIRILDEQLGARPGIAVKDQAVYDWIEALYAKTRLANLDDRMSLFKKKREDLLNTGDAMVLFASKLEAEIEEIRQQKKAFDGAVSKLRPRYILGLLAGRTDPVYPDANYTMRLSYGEVKGYKPRDAVRYDFLTSLAGILEKNTGIEPFIVPDELAQAFVKRDFGTYFDARLKDVPVNFLSTNDGTGGNSGSPVLNGSGKLVGLIFDTNYEAVSSDYSYNADLSRAINVDIRYVLFLLDKVYGITNVLDELTIKD